MSYRIDALQYCNWSEEVFRQLRQGGLDAIHVTIAYHETFRETVANLTQWNAYFERHSDLICPGYTAGDIDRARETGRTAVFFGFQNPSPIEDDIGLVEVWHRLGARFMQLSYNNQSLLATGCYEDEDPGITRMGRQVIAEMNRVGLVIDMSHSADRSTVQAAELSTRPITVTHANPYAWQNARRNKRPPVIEAIVSGGGMFGFSLYPHHLAGGSDCTLEGFCAMIADTVERYGISHFGIGSDLCQGQPDSVVEWMRVGRWSKEIDFGEGSAAAPGFPPQPVWFRDNRDFPNLATGLAAVGFDRDEIDALLGGNWYRFFAENFSAAPVTPAPSSAVE